MKDEDLDPPEWWKQPWPLPMTREQYEQEQIATAQSEQAWEANTKEYTNLAQDARQSKAHRTR